MTKTDHLPRQHPHADAYLHAQQLNAGVGSHQRVPDDVARFLFDRCLCGDSTRVHRQRFATGGGWWGVRTCKTCGRRWQIQFGGEIARSGTLLVFPISLMPHRARYRWALERWLAANPDRQIRLDLSDFRETARSSRSELALPSWPRYVSLRLAGWACRPWTSVGRLRGLLRQVSAPLVVLSVLARHVLVAGRYIERDGWWLLVRDDLGEGKDRWVGVHALSGSWKWWMGSGTSLPDPWSSGYRAGGDILDLVRLLTGLRSHVDARSWLRDHGYSPPKFIGIRPSASRF